MNTVKEELADSIDRILNLLVIMISSVTIGSLTGIGSTALFLLMDTPMYEAVTIGFLSGLIVTGLMCVDATETLIYSELLKDTHLEVEVVKNE